MAWDGLFAFEAMAALCKHSVSEFAWFMHLHRSADVP
jgi:hypothetical protein